jgi:NAD(P)-dependent dehydrogenase (short-subunit alcohol dehydrogenase family)
MAREMPTTVTPVYLDVMDTASVEAVAHQVERHLEAAWRSQSSWGCAVVNNAGTTYTGPLEFLPEDDLLMQFNTNLFGPLSVTQTLLPTIRRFGGRIVFVGSMFGRFSAPFIGPYCASKHALAGLSDSLAMELRSWGIPVSLVEPGVTKTPIWSKYDSHSTRLLDRLGSRARELYEDGLCTARTSALAESRKGMSADHVARTVEKIVSSKRPPLRYPVGKDARAGIYGTVVLPRRFTQTLTMFRMGLRRSARRRSGG